MTDQEPTDEPTLILSPDDSALILSPTQGIQVSLPDSIFERAEAEGYDLFALEDDDAMEAQIIWALAILLDQDEEFVSYIFDRLSKIGGEIAAVPGEVDVSEIDAVEKSIDEFLDNL